MKSIPCSGKTGPSGPVFLLAGPPGHRLSDRWGALSGLLALTLLAIAAPAADPPPSYRAIPLVVSPSSRAGFTRLDGAQTGLDFTNQLSPARSLTNHILLNGSGVAIGDVDGDGRPDIYLGGLDGPDRLFGNQGGWRFEPVRVEVDRGADRDTTGVVLADVDGDGDLDLLLNSIGLGTAIWLNDGRGRFAAFTEAGTASASGSMSLALADVDGDGDLDLYVANYRTSTIRDRFGLRLRMNRVNGRLVVTAVDGRPTTEPDLVGRFSVDPAGKLIENGEADRLYLNQGGGRFLAVDPGGGAFLDEDGAPIREPLYDWSLSAMFRDINGDGWPDLYVCSDMVSPDRIWINQRDGRFQAMPWKAMRKTSWFSMGIDFGDLDRDGMDDFLVTDMVSRQHLLRQVQVSNHQPVVAQPGVLGDRPQAPRNTLFRNQGDGDYAEVAFAAGLEASEWSWAPVFLDVDLDGFEDVLVATGFERDVQDIDIAEELEGARQSRQLSDAEALVMRARFPPLKQANLLFRNRGDLTFEEVGVRWGFAEVGISQGMALGDLDGDGDQDVVVNSLNGPVSVYRNDSSAPRVAVRLRGRAPNTRGLGARILLRDGAVPLQSQEMVGGGRYLSCDDAMRVFAAGALTNRMVLEVRWPGGRVSRLDAVKANHLYEIDEPTGDPSLPPSTPDAAPPPPLFEDVSDQLAHRHTESPFDDFARQPLLPRRMSQAGPAVAWGDLDDDGWPDLVVGTGRGGLLGLFRNDTHGGFLPFTHRLSRPVSRDVGALLVWPGDGPRRLLAALSNLEGADGEPSSVMELNPGTGTAADAAPPDPGEPGPILVTDMDGDGDLDLFVGGRLKPGRYPEAPDSRLFRREGAAWVADPGAPRELRGAGLINGGVFSDLDGDGFPELVVAADWGPLRVFRNDGRGALRASTSEPGLDGLHGWWQGVQAGDFDGDGRMDLIASNWGWNTRYRPGSGRPLHLFHGDFNQGGALDLLEAYDDPQGAGVVPWHHLGRVRAALPFVQARFGTYRRFAAATVAEILGERFAAAKDLTADWLATTLFLNRGDRWDSRPLPAQAQWAPSFGLAVADFDGDGCEDAFLAQNFFATDPEVDRHDGGRGLWVRGLGDGRFEVPPASRSGIRIYGEQRGAAVCDYDRDGRPDLVVGQNGQETKLFRNTGGQPGLRVRLSGPPGNPHALGAVLRWSDPSGSGPAREVHGGGGYLSQDGGDPVLARRPGGGTLEVRWPGGRVSRVAVPGEAAEVTVSFETGRPGRL